MKRRALYILLVLLLSMFLRLYPTLLSGLPFSTDSWPLIKNAEKLLELTPTPLKGELFDRYNIYWPLSQVYGAIFSEILQVSPLDSMRVYVPFAAAWTPLILYLILRRLTGSDEVGFIAGLLLAAGGPYSIFTAGVTKETFANIFLFQAIYLCCRTAFTISDFLGFAITVVALTMSHHVAYIVFLVIIANVLVAEIFLPRLRKVSTAKRLMTLFFSAVVGLVYYFAYAIHGLKVVPSFSEWLSAFSFQVLTFIAMFYVIARPKPRKLPRSWIALIPIALVSLLVNQIVPIVPGAPSLSPIVSFYASTLIFMGLFVILGLYCAKEWKLDGVFYPVLFWVSSVLGLECYAVFGASPGLSLTLAYRLPNFLIAGLASLAAIGILRAYSSSRAIIRCLSIVCLVFFVSSLASESYSAVILQENYLGYQWLYTPQDYQGALWVKRYNDGQVVYGDLKIKYLIGDYLGLSVDSGRGYIILLGEEKSDTEGLLTVYRAMEDNGYLLGPYGTSLPEDWKSNLDRRYDVVFHNVADIVYLK